MITFTKTVILLNSSQPILRIDIQRIDIQIKKDYQFSKPLLSSTDHRFLIKNSPKYQGIFRKDRVTYFPQSLQEE